MYIFKWAKHLKVLTIFILALALILGSGFTTFTVQADNAADGQGAEFSDTENHWAREQILEWSAKGLAAGYDDGTFRPERGVTRAEFIAFVNRAYGLTEKAQAAFSDVSPEDWFSGEIAKAAAAGYISGYSDGTMRPNAGISRQEAAVVLYKLLRLGSVENESWVAAFNDSGSIAAWSKEYVNAVAAGGYMSGYPDGTFKPERTITRAETVALLSKAVGTLYNVPGTYGPDEGSQTVAGNVTVNTSDVVLQNLVIQGDLYLAAGIGNGEFEANGVVVKGRTIVNGGGENSVVFSNTSLGEVIVCVVDGKVRVVAKGDTDIETLIMKYSGHLQEEGLTGEGFKDVRILTLKPGESIELDGDFDRVSIETAVDVSVTGDTRIGELEVAGEAEGTNIQTEKDTVIENLTLNAGAQVTGQGTIETAYVNTDDYDFVKDPDKLIIDGEEEQPSSGGSSGGGGSTPTVSLSAVSDISIQVNGTEEIVLTTNAAAITASSGDTNVAAVEVKADGKTLVVTGVSEGTAAITVTGSRSGYKTKTITFNVTVIAQLELISSYPYNEQDDFYPKYTYITLGFSESMKALDDPSKITLETPDGEAVSIEEVPVGINHPNCVLLIVNDNLSLDTDYLLYIPAGTLESESGKLYGEPISISFKTAHTVLKGWVYSSGEIEGSTIKLIDQNGNVIGEKTLYDGGYIFTNMASGQYTLKVVDTEQNEHEQRITVQEGCINREYIYLDEVSEQYHEYGIKVEDAQSYTAHAPLTSPTDNDFTGIEPAKVSIEVAQEKDIAYQGNVRIAPVGADGIQLWAKDTAGNWYDINVTGWGPAGGFPIDLEAVTDVYLVAPAGEHAFTIKLIDVTGDYAGAGSVIAEKQVTVTVTDTVPAQSTYRLTYDGLADSYTVGTLVTGETQAEINAAVETAIDGLSPIQVTLATDVAGQAGYEAVRILPVGAGEHIQLWAKDTAGNWYDINVTGWGPGTGFPLPAEYSAATDVYLLADAAGNYNLTIQLVDLNDGNRVIAQASGTVTVEAEPIVLNSTITQDPGNTGGDNATVTVDGKTITFGGEIAYYEAAGGFPPVAGNYVGVEVTAPTGITPGAATILEIQGRDSIIGWDNFKDGDNFFWYYPRVTAPGQEFIFTVKWDGTDAAADTFTIKIASDATLEVPKATSLTVSAENITATQGEQFSWPVNTRGTVAEADYSDMVRFYAVIPGLAAGDIELHAIDGGTPAIVTDAAERGYAGAAEGDLVLAWGPAAGFPLGTYAGGEAGDYDHEDGRTTTFSAAISKAGEFNVRFVFYNITDAKQINDEQDGARITVEEADTTPPELESVIPERGAVTLAYDETFILVVDAYDEGGLYELEVDHSMEGSLPEFSVYADADNPYGDSAAEFAAAGVTVTYDADGQKWTIDFGEEITQVFVDNGGITFYIVIKDLGGNQFGTMYGTTPENTFAYTITRAAASEASTYEFEYTLPQDVVAGESYIVPVTIKPKTVGDFGYDSVRFNVDVTTPDNATLQLLAEDTNGVVYDVAAIGYWGPSTGFPIGKDYTAATDFTAIFSDAGNYTITFSLVDLADEEPVVLVTETINITARDLTASIYKFDYEVPVGIVAGTEVEVDVTFSTDTEGDFGYQGVRFAFDAEGPDGSSVIFKATDSNEVEHTFVNEGYWGPTNGFDLPASYTATTTWTLTFSQAGNYSITFSLIDANTEVVIEDITDTVTIEVSAEEPEE